MENKGFEGTLPEESKKALQSETWQKFRDAAKEDPEAGKVPPMEQAKEEEPGSASDVTVENAESEQNPPEPMESKGTSKQESRAFKQLAKKKLKKELEAAKNKSFADPIIGYLLERCREDEGLAEDVVQEHKTWQKCFDYIYSQARKQANGNCAAVRDDVVYEWAEDYYHKDDKAEEEKRAKKEKKKEKQKKEAEEKSLETEEKSVKSTPAVTKKESKPKEQTKSRKSNQDMEGQLDLFSLMG